MVGERGILKGYQLAHLKLNLHPTIKSKNYTLPLVSKTTLFRFYSKIIHINNTIQLTKVKLRDKKYDVFLNKHDDNIHDISISVRLKFKISENAGSYFSVKIRFSLVLMLVLN